MKSTIYTYCTLLGYYILVWEVLVSHSVPISQDYNSDNPGVIYLNSLQVPANTVDQPGYKVSSVDLADIMRRVNHPTPHKRHHLPHAITQNENANNVDSCCPSVQEIVEPLAGKNISGHLVELYQSKTDRQRFHEISCDPAILNKNCKFLDRKHHEYSRCEQQYSYSYALVYDSDSEFNDGLRMDYIQIRSGCACKIDMPV